jgi:adenine phosphoribosyltransferase
MLSAANDRRSVLLVSFSARLDESTANALHERIEVIPDFPKPGVQFRDVSGLLRCPKSFQVVIEAMAKPYLAAPRGPTHIVGIESRGFIFGAAMAAHLQVGFVPVRKAGKLPGPVDRVDYALEYGVATLELRQKTFQPGDRVVIVDDLLATGGTAEAAARLVRMQGATVLSFDCVVELRGLGGRSRLASQVTGAPDAVEEAPIHVRALLVYP